MRIRFKPWARPELEASEFYRNVPEEIKGNWEKEFKTKQPIHLELGCGKGNFISHIASENKNINYVAVDLIDAMLGLAKRKVEEVYSEKNLEVDNLILIRYDIERIDNVFSSQDKIQRIYINFCNPWPKAKHKKKRLTHIKQLQKYKQFLADKGEIYFKTDDDELFEDSINYFEEAGFKINKKIKDLHKDKNFWNNYETEHEKMFTEQGIKIKALIATKI